MRKPGLCLFAVILAALSFNRPLPAEDMVVSDVRVAVFPLWYNEEIDNIGPALSETVQSTIQWILRFVDGYTLVETEAYPEGQFQMGDYVKKNNLDNVIYGRVDYDGTEYSISILLYDARNDRLAVVKQGSVKKVMEIFALADTLSVELIEQFIGRKLEYGSIVFEPSGDGPGIYRILINGIPFGEDIAEIPRFLTGEYRLTIEQVNGKDTLVIADRTLTLGKDKTVSVPFAKVRYGYLNVLRKGYASPVTLTDSGQPRSFKWNNPVPVPVGARILEFRQLDGTGQPWLLATETVSITEGETSPVTIKTILLSRGIILSAPEGASYVLTVNGSPYQGGPLPAGKYLLAVYPGGVESAEPVLEKTIRLGEESEGTVTVSDDGSAAYAQINYLKPDLLVELQTAAGSWAALGGRAELLGGRLGLSLLAGYYMKGEIPAVSGQFKAHWIFLPSALLRPAAGVSLFYSTDFNRQEWLAGPEVELAWETGLPVLTQVYAETGLYYRFGAVDYMINWRFAIGVRLF
jgi:hypothetical protein